ncbi:MAG TPA: nucleoside monophosphate kinase [Bryobacteraceae bacterium]|nr:nucleoside monophosphate kinase [Bryobacteraceae bacterium]
MFSRCTFVLMMAAATGAAQLHQSRVLILIGPPGSGKSVQAKVLSKSYKVPAISMATVLKESIGKNTPVAQGLKGHMASGELVGDDAANEAMKTRLLRKDAGQGFILDGYPTNAKQANALDVFLAEQGFPKPIIVILEAPDSVLRERLKSRKRADDTPENIDRRLSEYRDLGTLAEKRYGTENTVRVDGTGSIQGVALAITQQIDNMRSKKGFAVRPQQSDGLKQRPPAETPSPQ